MRVRIIELLEYNAVGRANYLKKEDLIYGTFRVIKRE
jgi:hypothetical protein